MTWWPKMHLEVLLEFARAQRAPGRRPRWTAPEDLLWWTWHRERLRERAHYGAHRAADDAWYRERLRRSAVRYRTSQVARSWYEQWHAARRLRRALTVAPRLCPECGAPVLPRDKGRGTRPRFCSVRCNRRAANRAWWRRNHGAR